jgi:crossover junction endodeoxyribonuclease RusA
MTELTFTLPWPPSINSMYSQGIIGGKRNLEEPFVEVLRRLAEDQNAATIGDALTFATTNAKNLRAIVKQAFGSPRASMFLSDAGKAYRELAAEAIDDQHVPRRSLNGRLAVAAIAYPPDARTRDLDNLWKSALDVLKHCNVITDDGHIDDLHVKRAHQVKGGKFVISVREITEAFESRQQGLELPPPAPPRTMSGKAPF